MHVHSLLRQIFLSNICAIYNKQLVKEVDLRNISKMKIQSVMLFLVFLWAEIHRSSLHSLFLKMVMFHDIPFIVVSGFIPSTLFQLVIASVHQKWKTKVVKKFLFY
jgi:hypothetical protein